MQCTTIKGNGCLHNLSLVPEDGVRVEILGRVEPKVEPLFSVAHSVHIHVCLYWVWFPCGVS